MKEFVQNENVKWKMRMSNGLVTSIEKLENASVGVERSVSYGVIVARRSLLN